MVDFKDLDLTFSATWPSLCHRSFTNSKLHFFPVHLPEPPYTPEYVFIELPHHENCWFLAPIACEILQKNVSLQLFLIAA